LLLSRGPVRPPEAESGQAPSVVVVFVARRGLVSGASAPSGPAPGLPLCPPAVADGPRRLRLRSAAGMGKAAPQERVSDYKLRDSEGKLQDFKRKLLSFDFYRDIVSEGRLEAKDDAETDAQKLAKKYNLTEIPIHFEDVQHYIDVVEPLFWMETMQQVQRDKETDMPAECEQIQFTGLSEGRGDSLGELRFQRRSAAAQAIPISSQDLVLLTQGSDPRRDKEHLHLLGYVESSWGVSLTVTVVVQSSTGDVRFVEVVKKLLEQGRENMTSDARQWGMAKVTALATMAREFEALYSLPRLPLRDMIVNREDSRSKDSGMEMQGAGAIIEPKSAVQAAEDVDGLPPPLKDDGRKLVVPETVDKALRARHNGPQMESIQESCKVSGITLVQGPPGTGKTTTILGILSVLLSATAKASKAVYYGARSGAGRERGAAEDSESSDEDAASIEARRLERVHTLRARTRWLQGKFVPWQDALEQNVPVSGTKRWREPYPKLSHSEITPMSEVQEDVTPKKVLVCAPSNAAIDEVVRRVVRNKLINSSGLLETPSIVRLGQNVHRDLEDYGLDNIVKRRVKSGQLANKAEQDEERLKILKNAKLVCMTLSMSGHRDMVGFPGDFDTVVIDEASQGVEMSTLVPLKLGCRRLILVGDPQQLPATCFSGLGMNHKYNRSLFERLQESQHKVCMLSMQYRMHPLISAFPSANFYDGKLTDGKGVEEYERENPAPWSKVNCFAPVVFFDLKGTMETSMQSFINLEEAMFIVHLFDTVSKLYPPAKAWCDRFAVISPYREQVMLIRAKFNAYFQLGTKEACPIDVNTVDGFQGREKECVVLSAVRADASKGIGFVRDKRRMNVAFTRARTNLWVVGAARVLSRNEDWRNFIKKQAEDMRLLRVGESSSMWLPGYTVRWRARHPAEAETLPAEARGVLDAWEKAGEGKEAALAEGDAVGAGFTWSGEELDEFRQRDIDAALRNRKDVEEAPSEDASSIEEYDRDAVMLDDEPTFAGDGGADEQRPSKVQRLEEANAESGNEGEGL
ncbi:unnamed protein product, partial [Prorocentrum cordatum]